MGPEMRFGQIGEDGLPRNIGSGAWSSGKTSDSEAPVYRVSLNSPAMPAEPAVVVTVIDKLYAAPMVRAISNGSFEVIFTDTMTSEQIKCGFCFVAVSSGASPVEQV